MERGEGGIIEFAGRKYLNCPSQQHESSCSSSGDESSYSTAHSEGESERRNAARSNAAKRKREPSPKFANKKRESDKAISDAFAFLDCQRNSEDEDGEDEEVIEPSRLPQPRNRRARAPAASSPMGESTAVEPFVEQVVRRMGRDEDWDEENDIGETDKEKDSHFKPCISPFRRMLEAMLRPDEDAHDPRCWGCDHQEDGDYAVVEKQWNTLINMFDSRMHKMHPAHLGVYMYRFFAERTAVRMTQVGKMDANAQLVQKEGAVGPGGHQVYQFDYSVWSAFSMFRHFTEHSLSPKTQITMDIWKLLFAKIRLEADGFYKEHDRTRRIIVDKEAVQTYKLLNQQIYQLYRMKPEQLLFFNPNSSIDTNGYSILNQDRPIIHSHGGNELFRMNYDTTN